MKYLVRVMLRGEGYAARHIEIEAATPDEAKEKALALYISFIDVDDPEEVPA